MPFNTLQTQSALLTGLDGDIWHDYYHKTGIDPSHVRPACHAKKKISPGHSKAIVLVHGIIDSPFSQTDIASIFFDLGYDVYLPLLGFHGLNNIESMCGVSYQEWLSNVVNAIELLNYDQISISGFSLGGLIAFYLSQKSMLVTGNTYLFSTPFEFKQQKGGVLGKAQHLYINHFSRLPMEYIKKSPLVDEMNPYIYEKVDFYALREMIKLQQLCAQIIESKVGLRGAIYAYHSECDARASSMAVETLAKQHIAMNAFIFDKAKGVGHGAILFKKPVYRLDGKTPKHIIENRNCFFEVLRAQVKCDERDCF